MQIKNNEILLHTVKYGYDKKKRQYQVLILCEETKSLIQD